MNEKFFIYKSSYIKNEKPDLSFVPMMARRKLSTIARITFALLNDCYAEPDINLVFASQFGEFDRLEALISQYTDEKEVSPISFGSSVHNASIGAFSLFKGIKNKYNAVSAGVNSLSNGFLEAVLDQEKTLFCYADTLPELRGAACLIGKVPSEGADEIEFIPEKNDCNKDEFVRFVRFLNKENSEFISPVYTLRRLK